MLCLSAFELDSRWVPLRFAHVSGKQPFSAQTTTPFTRAKKIGTVRQIFGTVLTILRRGNPNFRRVNVLVPNVMWHQCS